MENFNQGNEKEQQKFERVNINLLDSSSWKEKVLELKNFFDFMSSASSLWLTSFDDPKIISFSIVQVVRLHLLLTVKESAINVPMNLEARRRITFFANSLFMTMPPAPKVRNMLSFRYHSY